MRLAGAVLTGGASRRMGRDKATLDVAGRPMARIVADALGAAGCTPVVAVGGADGVVTIAGLPVVPDGWPGIGPLGGVLGALTWCADEVGGTHVLVAACDLPLLAGSTLMPLVEAATADPDVDVVVGATCGDVDGAPARRLEPAVAIWRVSSRGDLAAAAERGVRALHVAIEERPHLVVDLDATALRNVNVADDLHGSLPPPPTARYPGPP